jgi:hypothetical protein
MQDVGKLVWKSHEKKNRSETVRKKIEERSLEDAYFSSGGKQ